MKGSFYSTLSDMRYSLSWSSVIVANNLIYITGRRDSLDYLSAIAMNGEIKWQTPYGLVKPWTMYVRHGDVLMAYLIHQKDCT